MGPRRQFAIVLVLGLTLSGCGLFSEPEAVPPTRPTPSAASPSQTPTGESSPTASASPSAAP